MMRWIRGLEGLRRQKQRDDKRRPFAGSSFDHSKAKGLVVARGATAEARCHVYACPARCAFGQLGKELATALTPRPRLRRHQRCQPATDKRGALRQEQI